jgi:hypothetical protein
VCPVVPGGVAGPLAPAGSLACPWPSSAAKPWPWSRCSAPTAGGWPTNCARHKAGGTASRWWTGSCWGSWRSRSAMPDQAQLIRDFTSSPTPPRPPSSPGPPRRPGMAGARSIPFKTRSPPLPNLAEADPRYRQGGAMRGRSGPFWDGVEGRAPIPPRRGPGIPGGVAARRRRGGRRHRHRARGPDGSQVESLMEISLQRLEDGRSSCSRNEGSPPATSNEGSPELERVPGRARGQDPDMARDLSGRR